MLRFASLAATLVLVLGCDSSFSTNDPDAGSCRPYCGSIPAGDIVQSCAALGPRFVRAVQCHEPPDSCLRLATSGPATCPDGSADPVYCCP